MLSIPRFSIKNVVYKVYNRTICKLYNCRLCRNNKRLHLYMLFEICIINRKRG